MPARKHPVKRSRRDPHPGKTVLDGSRRRIGVVHELACVQEALGRWFGSWGNQTELARLLKVDRTNFPKYARAAVAIPEEAAELWRKQLHLPEAEYEALATLVAFSRADRRVVELVPRWQEKASDLAADLVRFAAEREGEASKG